MKFAADRQRPRSFLLFALTCATILPSPSFAQSGPRATPDQVAAALADTPKIPAGPYAASWDSIRANYQTPEWFLDAKFGIFMHFGLYSVAAHGSEWYEKYIYGGNAGIEQWHVQKFGPLDTHGYIKLADQYAKDFDPEKWAVLFKKAGAKYIVPTAQHHDGFANWDSAFTPFNSMHYGPKRDIIGDLGAAVRKQGLKFGVSNHGMEHFTFIATPKADLKSDLMDPAYADFYQVADRSPAALVKFLSVWVKQNDELIDKYQPDLLWFDNGVNGRVFDPLKLAVAAYYYNRAAEWGKQVTLSTKSDAYLAGSVLDYERQGRAPKPLVPTPNVWEVDDPIGEKFGYVEGMKLTTSAGVVRTLIEDVCRGGALMLNISPKGDGTIPEEQQQILLGVGAWLAVNGDAIYGTRTWTTAGEGDIRYTKKGDTLYAIVERPVAGKELVLPALATGKAPAGKIDKVEWLGSAAAVTFTQDETGLKVALPATLPSEFAAALKITGLNLK